MAAKTNKSHSKRLKITKNGKVLKRTSGQAKLRSKRSGQKKLAQRKLQNTHISKKTLADYVPHS